MGDSPDTVPWDLDDQELFGGLDGPVTSKALSEVVPGDEWLERWRIDPRFMGREGTLPDFLDDAATSLSMIRLPEAKQYASKVVPCLPGHVIVPEGSFIQYGPRQRCRVMILGMAPLQRDIEARHHLSGKAGKMLREAMARWGVSLDGCYATTVQRFFAPYPNMSTVPAEWIKSGLWMLRYELDVVMPEFILVLGAKALKYLCGSSSKQYTYAAAMTPFQVGSCSALVTDTLSPHDLVRNPEKRLNFDAHIRFLCRYLNGAAERDRGAMYYDITSSEQAALVLKECDKPKLIGIDTETEGLDWLKDRCITLQWSVQQLESFVLNLRRIHPNSTTAVQLFRQWLLDNPNAALVGQNMRFDLHVMYQMGIDVIDRFSTNGYDTMLMSGLLAENDDQDLTALILRETDMDRYDVVAQRMLDQGYKHHTLPDEVLIPYAGADTDALLRLQPVLAGKLWEDHLQVCRDKGIADPYSAVFGPNDPKRFDPEGPGYVGSLWNLYKFLVNPVTAPLCEVERQGMLIDRQRMEELTGIYVRKRDELLENVRALVHDPEFNPRSTDQMRELLFGDPNKEDTDGPQKLRLGLTPLKATGKRPKMWSKVLKDKEAKWIDGVGWVSSQHRPSTDTETLATLAEDVGSHEAHEIRNFRLIDQTVKMFLSEPDEDDDGNQIYTSGLAQYIDDDGKIRTTLSQNTKTGRKRSSSPNCQNITKGREGDLFKLGIFRTGDLLYPIRSIFRADPGHVFLEADYKSAELYVLAYIAGDKQMIADLASSDFHTVTAIQIMNMNISIEEYVARMKEDTPDGIMLKGYRVAAKAVNFGIPYQRQAAAIARQVTRMGTPTDRAQAQAWIDAYFDHKPDVYRWLEGQKGAVLNPGYTRTPYGRIRHFFQSDDEGTMAAQQRESCNFPIQSTVADAADDATICLYERRNLLQMKTRIALPIHDALMLHVPYEEVDYARKLLQWAMVDRPGAEVPGIGLRFSIDFEMGNVWNEHFNPWWMFVDSNGYIDERPKCGKCGKVVQTEAEGSKLTKEEADKLKTKSKYRHSLCRVFN